MIMRSMEGMRVRRTRSEPLVMVWLESGSWLWMARKERIVRVFRSLKSQEALAVKR